MNGIVLLAVVIAGLALGARAEQPAVKVDANADGVITGQEVAERYKANKERRKGVFKDLDTNHDGVLSGEEVPDTKSFSSMDLNKDGKITENEFLAEWGRQTTKKLDAADSNDDGQIDQKETQRAIEKFRERRKGN
jgi:Ca2+-binding EF-hand superfamily protein